MNASDQRVLVRSALAAVIAAVLTAATFGFLAAMSCGPNLFFFVAFLTLVYGSFVFFGVGVMVAVLLASHRDAREKANIRPWVVALAASVVVFGTSYAGAYLVPTHVCEL